MRRRLLLAGVASLGAALPAGALAATAQGAVSIEPAVGAKVSQSLLRQTQVFVGFGGGGNVASLSVPGAVNATGAGGGGAQLPTAFAPGADALSVPADTSISVDTSGAAPGGGPYEGAMLVLVQYN